MVKKFIPWIAACVLILSIGPITTLFFGTTSVEITPITTFQLGK